MCMKKKINISKNPIRFYIISNFSLLIQALEHLIESSPQSFILAGSTEKCDQEASELVINANADLILLDIDSNPEEVVPLITTLCAASKAKILLITRLSDLALQDQAIIAGARGLIDRSVKPEMLLTAIEKVDEGQV